MLENFYNPIYNMPIEQKKAFADQLKAIEQQQETIKSLIVTTERQATVIKDLLSETEKQGKRSGIQGGLSLIFSIVAVLIAGVAAWSSIMSFKSDAIWQQEQIGVLEEIRQSIDAQD